MLSSQPYTQLAVAALSLTTLTQYVAAQSIPIAYCSTLNTATTNGNASIYQTEGLCYNFCLGTSAFAVLQGNQCWCSDYVPGSGTTSSATCNSPCVGYPADWCGNEGRGLFGYVALTRSPSGTRTGDSSGSTTSTRQVTTSASTTPIVTTATTTAESSTSSSTSSSSSTTTSSTTSGSTTTQSQQTTTPGSSTSTDPALSISLLTIGGGVVSTVTVTPSSRPQSTSSPDLSQASGGSGGLSTGGAVGLTVGLVALVGLVGAIVWCCFRRKRKAAAVAAAAAYEDHTPRGSSAGGAPQRTMSENSRYMLGTDGNRVVEAWQEDDAAGSRRSRLMPVDPRLDPFAPVYQRGDASKSRESVATIQDNHDYSRRMVGNGKGPLRAINPDS